MKKLFPVILFSLLFIMVRSQTLIVFDKVSLQPVSDVFVYTNDSSAITDENGKADIRGFQEFSDVYFQHPSYQKTIKSYAEMEKAKFKVFLTESPILMNEIVVSVSGWRQDKSAVPNKVTTISAGQISMQNPQTAADLLKIAGGVYVQKSQYGGGSPMIRGFAANRVLIAVDGVRMNNAIFRSGNLQNVISIDPFIIKNTEVSYGAGSVIYGSDAIGGVMNFYTLIPTLSTGEKAHIRSGITTRYATAGSEITNHIDLNVGYKKWAYAGSFTFSDFGDLKMGSHGPTDYLRPEYVERIDGMDSIVVNDNPLVQKFTGYSQYNLMQKFRIRPNENWDLVCGWHYSKTSGYDRYDRLIRYKNGNPRSAEWYYGPQVWNLNNLNITHSQSTEFYDKVNLIMAYQHFEESRHDRDFMDNHLIHRYEKVDVATINIDFEKKLKDKHRIFYGIEILHNKVGSSGNDEDINSGEIVPTSSRYPDGSSWNSYATYFSWWNKLSRKLTLQTGARYNYTSLSSDFDTSYYNFPFTSTSLNNGALTGGIGLIYKPDDKWLYKLNLTTAFRAPNIDDIAKVFDSGDGTVIVPNPQLKPEYAYNAEISVKRRFTDKIELDLSVFYIHLDQAMIRRDFTLNGQDSILYDGEMSRVQALQNAAHASVYGIHADIEAVLPYGFGFTSEVSYQKGTEEQEDGTTAPLRHAAPLFGSSHLSVTRDRFKADFYVVYNSEKSFADLAPSEIDKDYIYASDPNGNPYSPSWYTLNIKFRYQLNKHLLLSLGVENLTDQRYRPYSSGIAASGRNFIFSLKGMF